MFALTTFALAFCSVAFLPRGSSAQTPSVFVNTSCTPDQTPCALGCCPYIDGVCCADGYECCQRGQTCIPYVGICIGIQENDEGEMSMVSSKSTPVENLMTPCPPGTTACGIDKCCMIPNAVCCSDGMHCCPNGYRCDLAHSRCIKNSYDQLTTSSYVRNGGVSVITPQKAVRKSPFKSCPGGGKTCPSYTSCCIDDNGGWSCCPNPSLSRLGVGTGQCCDTVIGHTCCPDLLPHCTYFGCGT